MKVLHVNEFLARKGGVETYLFSLLPMLDERGVASVVAYGNGDPEMYAPSICVPGIRSLGFRSQGDARRQMQDVLRREQPDVIHLHNIQSVGIFQASLAYGSTVLTAHDYRAVCPALTFFYRRTREVCTRTCGPGCFTTTVAKHCLTPRPQYAGYYYYRTRWVTEQAHRFAHVIAPSEGARARLTQAGFDADDTTVLPYYCPLTPLEKPRPIPDTPTITFMGRIAPNKGYNYFVEALGQLPAKVQGVMVGSFTDETQQAVQQLARQHGCDDRLTLYRWASRAEVINILDNTTVFVFPSLWPETLGIVGLEALSRGVPVVASDLGGVREWLQDGQNGILVPPKSAAQIRDGVLAIIESKQKTEAFGEQGIATINERFLPSQHTDTLMRIYERIACSN